MPKQMPIALSQFTDPGDRGRKEYYQYAEAVLAQMCFDDIRDLMDYFACGVEGLIDAVVTDKMGTPKGNKWKR